MKKIKLTRTAIVIVEIVLFFVVIFVAHWLFNEKTQMFSDYYVKRSWGNELERGWIHQGLCLISILFVLFITVHVIWELVALLDGDIAPPYKKYFEDEDCNENDDETEKQINMKINWRKFIKWATIIFLVIVVFKLGRTIFTQSVFVFNTSKLYHNSYQQKVEEKLGFYDKLWKTYLQKDKITNVNKDVFMEATKLIMENRADGEQVTWKWLQENQPIPYSEFTRFYAELSSFIESERKGYFAIEKQCQLIARQNNTLLDTFPNNIYNKMLKLERIKFEYGFLSDKTNNVFATGFENIK